MRSNSGMFHATKFWVRGTQNLEKRCAPEYSGAIPDGYGAVPKDLKTDCQHLGFHFSIIEYYSMVTFGFEGSESWKCEMLK